MRLLYVVNVATLASISRLRSVLVEYHPPLDAGFGPSIILAVCPFFIPRGIH